MGGRVEDFFGVFEDLLVIATGWCMTSRQGDFGQFAGKEFKRKQMMLIGVNIFERKRFFRRMRSYFM